MINDYSNCHTHKQTKIHPQHFQQNLVYPNYITMASRSGFAPPYSGGGIAIPMNVILPPPRDDHYMQEIPLESLPATPHPRVVVQKTVSAPWRWLKEKTAAMWRGLWRLPKVHIMVNVAIIIILVAACMGLGAFSVVSPPVLIWLAFIFYGVLTFGQFLFSLLIDSVR
jgi:hypothetical protein